MKKMLIFSLPVLELKNIACPRFNKNTEQHGNEEGLVSIQFFNMKKSILGFTGPVHIDKNGDRIPLFNIDNVNNGKLVTVATYNPLNNKSIEMIPNEVIVFPGNTTDVPKDVPYCGFDHSKCLSGQYIIFLCLLENNNN